MEDTEPVTHILHHLTHDKSSERLVAFDVSNKGKDPYDNHLLLVTPSTALSLDLDREQAADLIEVLRNAFELDGVQNDAWACSYRCYNLPSWYDRSYDLPSKSKKRKKQKR
jgi:hypothetical protein